MRKVWNPNRIFYPFTSTPAFAAAGRRYFCTGIETGNGFLLLRRVLGKRNHLLWSTAFSPAERARNRPAAGAGDCAFEFRETALPMYPAPRVTRIRMFLSQLQ